MKLIHALLLAVVFLCGCQKTEPPSSPAVPDRLQEGLEGEQAAVAVAASELLLLIDSGKAGEAWEQASPVLKGMAGKATWIAGLGTMRLAVGDKLERQVKAVELVPRLDGAPPGEYAAMLIGTTFSRMRVEEKVFFQKHEGRWKVAGYFLSKKKPPSPGPGPAASAP
jgi:hypothetical protein